jgi:hypothetical protein
VARVICEIFHKLHEPLILKASERFYNLVIFGLLRTATAATAARFFDSNRPIKKNTCGDDHDYDSSKGLEIRRHVVND